MRVFGYYITHTVFNSIKKLFKTWIAFLLIIMAFSAAVGVIASVVASAVSKNAVEEVMQDEEVQEVVEEIDDGFTFALERDFNITKYQVIETAISGLFLFLFFLSLLGAKGMGDIFIPADVNMLFSAPMKPQSVMMFRLFTTLGVQILFSVFMLLQLPNLIINLHLSVTAAVVIFTAWIVVNLLATLCQVLIYILSSYSEAIKKNSKIIIYVILALILGIFAYNYFYGDANPVSAAVKTLTGEKTYWVPFWGWIRGMCMNAIYGNSAFTYMFLALNILGIVGLIVLVWNLKVDFYEDAIISTERKAELLEKSKELKTGVVRTKDRSDKIKRDDFNKGFGANVFFYKTLYNRRRLSYFGVLTKTMLIYALAVAGSVVIMRKADAFADKGFLLACGFMTLIAFYRTMGNPLSEDLSRDFFAMIPASARSKLFYSILGGLTNTLLDIIVPFVFAAIWFKAGIGEVIVWLLFLLMIDLYGTVVGAFIMMSVSISLPDMVQKMVQIIFIYFGIMPALVFVVLGIVFNNMVLFMPFGIVMNLALSFLFFMLIPGLMQNGRK